HPFNHRLELLFPTLLSSQQENKFLKETFYYKADIPLSYFIERSFIQDYLQRGRVVAQSLGEGIDVSNVIALDGFGYYFQLITADDVGTIAEILMSNLDYPGNLPSLGQIGKDLINLLEKSMIPGKKGFERIKWCFNNTLSDPFPFLISYVDSATQETQKITFPPTFNAKKFTVELKFEKLNNIIFPDMKAIKTASNEDQWRSDIVEVYDWFGMASLRAQSDQFSNSNIPWAVLSVWGFKDSPISWNRHEH
ncbi:9244_t:CDS:2, partial [Cetraspora pellucida]